jgi:hypothetical protein
MASPLVLVALLLAGAPPAAPGDSAPAHRLALKPLKATEVEPALVALVETKLCEDLGSASGWEMVCPEDVAAMGQLAKGEVSFGTCSTKECLDEMAAMTRSERTVSGELARDGKNLVLALSLLDRESGRVLARSSEKLPADPDRLLGRIPEVARKLWKASP